MTPVVLTLGVFDGVHRGHAHIFRQVLARAREIRGTAVAYTFDPHPVRILAPESCPPMIHTLRQKLEFIRREGIQRVIVAKFTKAFARQTPEEFFNKTILRKIGAREIFVGYNFTFGVHRSGTIEHLETFSRSAGIRVTIVEAYFWKETLVSSTQIRQLLARGNLPKAEELLGHPYVIEGRVVRGRGLGGKLLGIHTANLRPENDPILPTGVYVTYVKIGGRRYESLTNIGPNPTFGPGPLSTETHIFNFRRSIFGQKIRIEFIEKIREEITFSSPQDLAVQIQNDIRIAKDHFKKRSRTSL